MLRLACQVSGGDVSLATTTRSRAFRRRKRRVLLAALNEVVGANPGKLGYIPRYAKRWKRLGERLHPHGYVEWPHAQAYADYRLSASAWICAGRSRRAWKGRDERPPCVDISTFIAP
jgi:hypothetical protein